MKRSYLKLIIFDIILIAIFLLNSFILNILNNYYMVLFLIILLVIFKFVFGFEKDKSRYIRDIIINISIIYLISFIVYYIFGIFIGFVRTENYLNFYGITHLIIPFIANIFIKEYLRFQFLKKTEKSKLLIVITCIVFILLDITRVLSIKSLTDNYSTFIFIALRLLPIISNNIVCTYISLKSGYKPNIFWLLIAELYSIFLPFVPNTGLYIDSLIKLIFPFVFMYNVYGFLAKREKNIPISHMKKSAYIEIPVLAIFVFGLAYFVSGFFRYFAIAVATGSMTPNINVGDVVIVDQETDYKKLKIGEVIAYKYDNVVIVHRLFDIAVIDDDYYFYTKGDANNKEDNYIIYPDTIIGKVNFRLPYVGLPTVWINELFKK